MAKILNLHGKVAKWSVLTNRIITNPTVSLSHYHGLTHRSKPVFTCKKLFVRNCDETFIYFNLVKESFPNVRELWLDSHPTDSTVLNGPFDKIYLLDKYRLHRFLWAAYNPDIELVDGKKFQSELDKFTCEPISFY